MPLLQNTSRLNSGPTRKPWIQFHVLVSIKRRFWQRKWDIVTSLMSQYLILVLAYKQPPLHLLLSLHPLCFCFLDKWWLPDVALITAGAIEEASEEAAILIIMTLAHAEISTVVLGIFLHFFPYLVFSFLSFFIIFF